MERLDPELLKLVENTNKFALAEGALPKKSKLLIAMALDASLGAVQGVKSLARATMQAGATKEEITETIRVGKLHQRSGKRLHSRAGSEGAPLGQTPMQ